MIKIYGSMQCPDCVECRKDLDKANVKYDYLDFADSLLNLKEFLSIRDQNHIFDEIRREGKIGIPCIVEENGSILLDWSGYVSQADA